MDKILGVEYNLLLEKHKESTLFGVRLDDLSKKDLIVAIGVIHQEIEAKDKAHKQHINMLEIFNNFRKEKVQ